MTRPPADQAVRARVGRDFDTTFPLEAGAGTAKTTVLVSRILAIIQTGRATLDRIVAISFTEKAAGELKPRLREGIEDALERTTQEDERQCLLAAATDLERAPVSTIHAPAAALLRESPFGASLDPGFKVAAEIAGERVLDDAWDEWFDQSMGEADALLRALTMGQKLKDLKQAGVRFAQFSKLSGALPKPFRLMQKLSRTVIRFRSRGECEREAVMALFERFHLSQEEAGARLERALTGDPTPGRDRPTHGLGRQQARRCSRPPRPRRHYQGRPSRARR